MMMLSASGGGVVSNLNASASNSAPGAGTSTAQVFLSADGTMGGGANYSGPAAWFQSPTSGIGSGYWVSFDGGAWNQLSSTRTTSITGTNLSVSRSVRVASDAAGANILGTGTIQLNVTNSA